MKIASHTFLLLSLLIFIYFILLLLFIYFLFHFFLFLFVFFLRLGFWSENFYSIAPFPDHCLLVLINISDPKYLLDPSLHLKKKCAFVCKNVFWPLPVF